MSDACPWLLCKCGLCQYCDLCILSFLGSISVTMRSHLIYGNESLSVSSIWGIHLFLVHFVATDAPTLSATLILWCWCVLQNNVRGLPVCICTKVNYASLLHTLYWRWHWKRCSTAFSTHELLVLIFTIHTLCAGFLLSGINLILNQDTLYYHIQHKKNLISTPSHTYVQILPDWYEWFVNPSC